MPSASPGATTGALALGVDVGGTKVLGRAVRADGTELAAVRRPTPRGADAIVAVVAEVLDALGSAVAPEVPDAVGVGIAGLVDRSGVLRFAPNLPGVVDLDLVAALGGATGPVSVLNDATAALWGEHRMGAAAGASDAVLVTLGTGIGGGLLSERRLVLGRSGMAGEPGHMLVDPAGPPCPCGRRGCWERFASGAGLARLARDAAEAGRAPAVVDAAGGDLAAIRGEHVTATAAAGDPGSLAVLHQFAWWVAVGIANLVDVCDPEVVVIGGGLSEAGELLLAPVRAAFAELVLGTGHRPPPRLELAALGTAAAATGAGLWALDTGFGAANGAH